MDVNQPIPSSPSREISCKITIRHIATIFTYLSLSVPILLGPFPNPSVHHGASPASAPCLPNPGIRSHLQDSPSLKGLPCDRVYPAVSGASLRRLPTLAGSCHLLGDDAGPRDRPQPKLMPGSRSAGPRAGFGAGAVGSLRGGCRWT